MEEVVGNMLMLAAIEGGDRSETILVRTDLNDVLSIVVDYLRLTAEASGIRLNASIGGLIPLNANPEELRVLCSNLIRNALQHSSHGNEVRVFAHTHQSHAELHVQDDGEGIPPEVLPHIFKRFYRGDASRSRRTGGTGLGLSIAKAIVDSMSGSLRIDSKVGEGTSVLVTLPLALD